MTTPSFHIQSIDIIKMPGFPKGDLEVDEFSPGINIIFGPNASGKTTICRALERVLRAPSGPTEPVTVRATFELDQQLHSFMYDMGHVNCQLVSDGSTISSPSLAPIELEDRYVLALHELIARDDGGDLASVIAKELSGGYEILARSRELNHRERHSPRGKLTTQLTAARKSYRDTRHQQEQLVEQQTELSSLREKKSLSQQAIVERTLIETCIQRSKLHQVATEAQSRLDAFPPAVSAVTPHIEDELANLLDEHRSLASRLSNEENQLKNLKQSLDGSSDSNQVIAPQTIEFLRNKLDTIRSLEGSISATQEEIERERTQVEHSLYALGSSVKADQLETLPPSELRELLEVTREYGNLEAEARGKELIAKWLDNGERSTESGDELQEAIQLLLRWIAANNIRNTETQARRTIHWIMSATLLLVSIVLAVISHPTWIIGAAFAIAWFVVTTVPQKRSDPIAEMESEYVQAGYEPPDQWNAPSVNRHLRHLQSRIQKASLESEKQAKWNDLSDQRAKHAKQLENVERQRREWIKRVGIDASASEVYFLASNLVRYQQSKNELQIAENRNEQLQLRRDEEFRLLEDEFKELGQKIDDDTDRVSAFIDQLDRHHQELRTIQQKLQQCQSLERQIKSDLERTNDAIRKLFERFDLLPDNEPQLREYIALKPSYDKAKEAYRSASVELQSVDGSLQDRPDLMELSNEQLEAKRFELSELADSITSTSERIGAIEKEIEIAESGSDLETAYEHMNACAVALREQREQDYRSIAGYLLARFVDSQERRSELPIILRRARELFASITHGCYELSVTSGESPQFYAKDTATNRGLALEELSSGTRLQLLLAVRVAFVERQEHGTKVPFLLDETLGNSDEKRAQQIIEAAIEICREGRQVFYFTAQVDEVAKWERWISEAGDVSHRLFDLAEIRQLGEAEQIGEIPAPAEEPPVPTPDGLTWLEYGSRLNVRRPVLEHGADDCHLWFFVSDLSLLYRLLSLHIEKWGQLRTLRQNGRLSFLDQHSDQFEYAQSRARVMDTICRLASEGRGHSIDRETLIQSKAVSEKFIDRVVALVNETEGDGRRLIELIEDGAISGFRTKNRDKLATFLVENGYIDERASLSSDEILAQTRSLHLPDLDSGEIDHAWLRSIISLLLSQGSDVDASTIAPSPQP